MARRNYSQELQEAKRRGAVIVCSVAPYDGTEMAYAPRRARDPLPWVPADQYTPSGSYDGMYRYGGRFCHATYTHYVDQEMWYMNEHYVCVLVVVNQVDEKTGTAQVKADHWNRLSTVPLDKLFKSYPSR